MKRQLGQLLLLLRVLDPPLCDFLGKCPSGQARVGGAQAPPPSLWKWPLTVSRTFGPNPDEGDIPAKAGTQHLYVKAGLRFGAKPQRAQLWACAPCLPHELAPPGSPQSCTLQMRGLGVATSGGAWTQAARLRGVLSVLSMYKNRFDLTCGTLGLFASFHHDEYRLDNFLRLNSKKWHCIRGRRCFYSL